MAISFRIGGGFKEDAEMISNWLIKGVEVVIVIILMTQFTFVNIIKRKRKNE